VRPEPRALPDETAQVLDSLLTRRRQLIGMLTTEKNRLGFARAPVKRDLLQHIRWLEKRFDDIDHDVHDVLRTSPLYQCKVTLLQSVPGVGPITACLTSKTVANENANQLRTEMSVPAQSNVP